LWLHIHVYSVDENNMSITEVEAGITQGIISECMPMKIMRLSLKYKLD